MLIIVGGSIQEYVDNQLFPFLTYHSKPCISCNTADSLYNETLEFQSSPTVFMLSMDHETPDGEGPATLPFPETLNIRNTVYRIAARIFSTAAKGIHFYARVVRAGRGGIYQYDERANKGYAQMLENSNIYGLHKLGVAAIYYKEDPFDGNENKENISGVANGPETNS